MMIIDNDIINKDGRSFRNEIKTNAKLWHYFFVNNQNLLLYHYTSIKGIKNILKTKTLWFSEYLYLNDSSEGEYVYSLLKEVLEKYKKSDPVFSKFKDEVISFIIEKQRGTFVDFRNGNYKYESRTTMTKFFICSFSSKKDCLPMWNYYSKSDKHFGYNLQFDLVNFKSNLKDYISNDLANKATFRIYKVLYKKSKQIALLKTAIDFFYNKWIEGYHEYVLNYFGQYLYSLRFFMKHEAFEAEKEIRFVIQMDEECFNEKCINKIIKYRQNDDYNIAYLEIPFEKECVKNIMSSPLTIDTSKIKCILDKSGYKNISIMKSSIPLRY